MNGDVNVMYKIYQKLVEYVCMLHNLQNNNYISSVFNFNSKHLNTEGKEVEIVRHYKKFRM